MVSIVLRAGLLLTTESAVAYVGWWLNNSRQQEGPVILPFDGGHGIHRLDLLVVAAGLLVAILVLAWPGAHATGSDRVRPSGADADPTYPHPTLPPDHDQLVSRKPR